MSCKSPIKFVGGKSKLLPEIDKYIPKGVELIYEPFCGSAALSFSKDIPFIISDMNEELIIFYKEVKKDYKAVLNWTRKLSEQHSKEFFLKVRAMDRVEDLNTLASVSRAARFLYINYHGFNGLWRVSKKQGHLNTPFGGEGRKLPADIEQSLKLASEHLNKYCIGIYHKEFDDMLVLHEHVDLKEVFTILDPPYEHNDTGKAVFQAYTTTQVDTNFRNRLNTLMSKLDNLGTTFLMTNTDCEVVRNTYKDWYQRVVDVNYVVGAKKEREGCKTEIFTSNIEV